MADSGAERQRRYEHHKRGDHRFCRAESCEEARAPETEREHLAFVADVTVPGSVANAVHAVLATLSFGEGDPRVVTAAVALRLADAIDSGSAGSARLSEELHRCVSHLLDSADHPPSMLDELRARHNARRGENLIEWAQAGAVGYEELGRRRSMRRRKGSSDD